VQSGYEGGLRLLSLPHPPTAVFAASDHIAHGVLNAARQRNIAVPDGLSVIGFDNLADSALVEPPLTTIHQPLLEIGEEAARLLFRQIQHETEVQKKTVFKPTLIIRASTASPVEDDFSTMTATTTAVKGFQ
jgi:DNA-binding LacI/PurR family transcriptional regulator